jgi:assimilatory nitrate reductase catalytic subunit
MACTQSLPGDMLAHDVLFWTGLPTEGGWRYELALAAGVDHATYLERLRVLVEHDNPVEFVDTVTGERRLLLERRHGPPVLVVFAHPQRAALPPAAFVARALVHSDKVEAWRMLAGPEGADADCSRAVCTCFGVREHAIRAAAMAGARTTAELGRQLRCGTNCGSCLPELRALIAACHQR